MAGSLPLVRGTGQALCPVTRIVYFSTDIAIALNSTEQRFKKRPPLTRFILPYTRVNAAETAAFKAFHASQRGTFDCTWDFTLGATTYSALTFEDAEFAVKEEFATPLTYSFTIKAKQTKNPGQTAGAAGAAFPTLANGLRAQLPYAQMRRFAVLLNDNAHCGIRYAWTWQGAGLTGFPTGALHGWELTYPSLSDADTATLEEHFRDNWGRWGGPWSFTDPDDGAVYTKCRYDSDQLEIVNRGPNQNALTLRILETF